MSKRCKLQKEYYKEFGNYKGYGRYTDHYVNWLESKVLALRLCDVGSSFVEYEKQVSMDAITLKDITEDNIVVGRYLLDEGKLYKIDLVEKYTLIDLK